MKFSRFYECGIENPHSLSSPYRRIDCGDFCVLGYVDANTVFPVCISNFSNKLARGSLRYEEAVQLAEVLGYELVWQKRRDA